MKGADFVLLLPPFVFLAAGFVCGMIRAPWWASMGSLAWLTLLLVFPVKAPEEDEG